MLSSVERVSDVGEAAEQSPLSNHPMTRYQVFYTSCYSSLNALTRGHAAEVIRLASFLFVGGVATLVNLGLVWLFSRHTPLPYALYTILATEVSLLCNFSLNDRLTFRSLLDGRRSWWKRCVRFHGPATVGFLLTLFISDTAYYVGHLAPVFAQGLAILIVTFVNFFMHRLWTYRPSHQPLQG
jgi:putative flippase GtrA